MCLWFLCQIAIEGGDGVQFATHTMHGFAVVPTETGVKVVVNGLSLKVEMKFAGITALRDIDVAEQGVGGRSEVHLAVGVMGTVIGKGWQIAVKIESLVIVVDSHIENGCLRDTKIDIQQTLQPIGLIDLESNEEVIMDVVCEFRQTRQCGKFGANHINETLG